MEMLTLELAKRYTDSQRVAYTETKVHTLFSDTQMEFQIHPEISPDLHLCFINSPIPVEEGQIVHVLWDKSEYVCEVPHYGYIGNQALGAPSDEEIEDTGEPFLIIWDEEKNTGIIVTSDSESFHSLRVVYKEEIVKKQLDYKLLPVKRITLTGNYSLDSAVTHTLSEDDQKLVNGLERAYNDYLCVELSVPDTNLGKRLTLFPHTIEVPNGLADYWQSIPFVSGKSIVVYNLHYGGKDNWTLSVDILTLS